MHLKLRMTGLRKSSSVSLLLSVIIAAFCAGCGDAKVANAPPVEQGSPAPQEEQPSKDSPPEDHSGDSLDALPDTPVTGSGRPRRPARITETPDIQPEIAYESNGRITSRREEALNDILVNLDDTDSITDEADLQPSTAGPPATAPAISPANPPVYNLELEPLLEDDPLVIPADRDTLLTLSIGAHRTSSVLPRESAEIHAEIERLAGGEPIDLNVTLSCSFCRNLPYQRKVLQYQPQKQASRQDITFSLSPDRDQIDSSGIGTLVLAIDSRGIDLNILQVPVFVGQPDDEQRAGWTPPSIHQLDIASLPEQEAADLIIDITDAPAKLRVTLIPGDDQLREHLATAIDAPDLELWTFESGVSKQALDDLVRQAYFEFRALVEQHQQPLQAVYATLGRTRELSEGAARLDMSPADRNTMTDVFKLHGSRLYRFVFLNGEPKLRLAMRALEQYSTERSTGDPLKLRIRTRNVYAPWQVIYTGTHNAFDNPGSANPALFWGFQYAFGTRQLDDTAQASLQTVMQTPEAEHTLFAAYRDENNSDDHVTQRAGLLSQHIASHINEDVEIADSKLKFLKRLAVDGANVRFIVAYGHASSGTVIGSENETAVFSNDLAGQRFLFSAADHLEPLEIDDIAPPPGEGLLLDSQPFVLFTACETGTAGSRPMSNISFVGALTRAGARTVIVTESPVWSNFAYHFSTDIVDGLLQGKSAQETMLTTRLTHLNDWNNPMGLLFSLYGEPSATIVSN